MNDSAPRSEPSPFAEAAPLDAAQVDVLIDQVLGHKPRPIAWARVDHDTAIKEWAALDRWVRWLVRRYNLDHRDIPPCWFAHGDLVEELSALHTAHRGAFDPSGAPGGPASWHDMLANTRAHLQLAVSRTGCRVLEHRSAAVIEWATDPAPDEYRRGLRVQVEADAAERK